MTMNVNFSTEELKILNQANQLLAKAVIGIEDGGLEYDLKDYLYRASEGLNAYIFQYDYQKYKSE